MIASPVPIYDLTVLNWFHSRLMKKLGNACNELGKYFLSTTVDHAAAFRWFERGCQVFSDIEDSVNVALLSANLAHLHKILAQKEASDFKQQQQHYEQAVHLCLDAASLLKHHKLDADAMLHRKVTGELALTYLVWGVALANTSDSQQESRDSDALKKFSKALALYTEIGDIKQSAATHYQIASFHARQISQEASNQKPAARDVSVPQKQSSSLKNRMEIARRHYEKALEYFGRMELGATFVLIHQELADLYALGGRVDDLDHALLVLLNTVHAFQTAGSQVQALARTIMTKIQSVIYQLVRLSATAAVTSSGAGKRATQANAKDDSKSLAMIDAYKRMYKEVLYFNAATTATAADSLTISPTLATLQSIYDEVSSV
jgi:tetratricopeptide (TPR) repeat protein